jgi:hypothetical protein
MSLYGDHIVVSGGSEAPLAESRLILMEGFAATLPEIEGSRLLSFKLIEFACDLTDKVTVFGEPACASGVEDHWHLGWKAEIE